MARDNRTRQAVLGALSLGPSSGTELREDLERTVGHFWHESYGQLYPTLRQLVDDGAATVTDEPSRTGRGRPRRVYAITDAGREELLRWLARPPAAGAPPRNELLLKVFFGAAVPADVTRSHVERHRDELREQLANLEQIEEELAVADLEGLPDRPYWLSTLRYGRALTEAGLAWCEQTLGNIDEFGHP